MITKIGRNLYHVVTPAKTQTFTTRSQAREFAKAWAPSQTLTLTTPLTPALQLRAVNILS